jgi:vacuolar iron transporter family protein
MRTNTDAPLARGQYSHAQRRGSDHACRCAMNFPRAKEFSRLLRNLRAERDSAVLYDTLAELEPDPRQRSVYHHLASAERQHAAFWEARLAGAGQAIPHFRPSLRTALLALLARHLGIGFIVPSVITREMKDRDDYTRQDDARAAGLAQEEHAHAAALRPKSDGALGNTLRAAVLGANDGLTSNFCLLMGVAGGGGSARTLLLTGIAGLVAGAGSMALGEWLSVTNAREFALSQVDRDMGMQAPDASHPSVALAGNAASVAGWSFLLFALGALLPLLPVGLLPTSLRVPGSIALSVAALFALGLATSLFNARSPLFSGLRQVAIGAAAAAVTYVVGRLFGFLMGG